MLFSTADRCFPRAQLQPPRETHSAGSSDTCYSRRSQRSSAPNNHGNSDSELYTSVPRHQVSEGNIRGLLEKENRFFCVRCISKKLSWSCGNSGQSETSQNDSSRRLTGYPRKAECISEAVYVAVL